MKRSEMVEIITQKLSEMGIVNSFDYSNAVLKAVENAGMLPPVMEGVYDPVPTLTPTGNLDYGWARGWEQE